MAEKFDDEDAKSRDFNDQMEFRKMSPLYIIASVAYD